MTARYSRPSECGKEHAAVDVNGRSCQPSPRRADEIAEPVDRTHRRLVERADERGAGDVRRVVFDVAHAGADVVLVEADRGSDGAGQPPDAGDVAQAVADRPPGTVLEEKQRLAPQMRAGISRDGEHVDVAAVEPSHAETLGDGASGKPATCLMRRKRSSSTAAIEPAVADEDRGDVTVVGVQAENVHDAFRARQAALESPRKPCLKAGIGEGRQKPLPPGSAEADASSWLVEQREHGSRQIVRLIGFHDQASHAVANDFFGRAVGADARFPRAHRLEKHETETLVAARHAPGSGTVRTARPVRDRPTRPANVTACDMPSDAARDFEPPAIGRRHRQRPASRPACVRATPARCPAARRAPCTARPPTSAPRSGRAGSGRSGRSGGAGGAGMVGQARVTHRRRQSR